MHEKKRFGKVDKEFSFKYSKFERPKGHPSVDNQRDIILEFRGEVEPRIVKICRFISHRCWHHQRSSAWMEKPQALLLKKKNAGDG